MKTIIILTILAFNVNAGEVSWISDNGFNSVKNCELAFHRHSAHENYHKYIFKCKGATYDRVYGVDPIEDLNSSSIVIEGVIDLYCPVEISAFYSSTDFSMFLNCTTN